MTASSIQLIKFDSGSPTDQVLRRMQARLGAANIIEAMRRSLTIADRVTDFALNGQELYVRGPDGAMSKLVIT